MNSVFAIADLHLSFGVPDKAMDFFGESWKDWTKKIEENWRASIGEHDLVLIAGDISWGMRVEEAVPDLQWIDQLPGTKVLVRGNHDFWWSSLSKIEKVLPKSIHLIQNNCFNWEGVSIGGSRLFDTSEYQFNEFINYTENSREKKKEPSKNEKEEKALIFEKELIRLENSFKCLSPTAAIRIAMTHYPPIGADLETSKTSLLLDKYKIDAAVFGHLHNVKQDKPLFGKKNLTSYYLTSCDYLNFKPIKILDLLRN